MALEAGQRVGEYEILAQIGAGGMGRVYKVRNIISNREEAMKILLPDFASEPELAARFMVEIRTLAGLEHPNIAQLRTAFQFQNQLVMIMEFVEGAGLDKMGGQSKLALEQVIEYSTQVLSALSYAHGKGVIHRDIKPANIMITTHGLVKLMDFGIAKGQTDMHLTRPGTTMGSVYYMSPEQVRGGTVDARSDIYSYGVTLYEMLTGRKPFQADTSYSVLNAQLNEAPTPPSQLDPSLAAGLNDIVLRAMAKNPGDRFQTADEFRNALKTMRPAQGTQPQQQPVPGGALQVAGLAGAMAAPPPVPPPAGQQQGFAPVALPAAALAPARRRSNRGLWMVFGAVAAVLALAAVATILPRMMATHASQKSTAAETQGATASPGGSGTAPGATGTEAARDAAMQPNPMTTAMVNANPVTNGNPAGNGNTLGPSGGNRTGAGSIGAPMHGSGASSGGPGRLAGTNPQTPNPGGGSSASGPPAPPPGPSPAEIRQTRDRLIALSARADAARQGVEQIRGQQQAQGLDIRGDVLASMNRMNSYLSEANRALDQNDLSAANDYMDRADKETSSLESFLGR